MCVSLFLNCYISINITLLTMFINLKVFTKTQLQKEVGRVKQLLKKKIDEFLKSFLIWDCISFKGPGEMIIITPTVNGWGCIGILDNFLIPFIELGLVTFFFPSQVDNVSYYWVKGIKAFLQEKDIWNQWYR